VDAPCATYENVLFHDNCWEDVDTFVRGEAVAGAYVRQLYNISGGYQNNGDPYYPHSNAHLWYHGGIDLNTPTSDLEASITINERTNWWVSYEDYGLFSGFYYSLIGGGNRLSTDQPLGPGFPAIVSGYNQNWPLGAGISNPNRTTFSSNNGTWPNVIKFDVTGTNIVKAGDLIYTTLYYQYAGASNISVTIYFAKDFNPYDTNSTPVFSTSAQSTGGQYVTYFSNLGLTTTNVPPGVYAIYGKISDGVRSRYLYAPEIVQIVSNNQPPVIDITRLQGSQYAIGINGVSGQTIVLQSSTDVRNWIPLVTNTLTTSRWIYTNTPPASSAQRFYRAILNQ
jgi:hypothetical protein